MSGLFRAVTAALFLSSSLSYAASAPTEVRGPEGSQPPSIGDVSAPKAGPLERITLFGYARIGFSYFVPHTSSDALIGSRSGFRLLNARVGVRVAPADTLDVIASMEGSATNRDTTNPLVGSRLIRLADAFVEWRPSKFFEFRLGQFKTPFNAEFLLTDNALPLIGRSIVTEGLFPPEGLPVNPLSLDRQLGIQVASRRLGTLIGFSYALALVNGNGPNQLQNDNNSMTPVGRVMFDFAERVIVGFNGYYNDATVGELPLRLREKRFAYGADLGFKVAGFTFLGMALLRDTSYSEGIPSDRALGVMASLHYRHEPTGLEIGGRYARYEPSRQQALDAVGELTSMLGISLRSVPLRFLFQYTVRSEEVAFRNNSADALAQVTF